ncbi:hypothetical protein SUGI_0177650 [Cryptomeria japonica]|nr:hypothetical protein SUGI_0177650 [Cryptomeria japonica]
MIVSVTGLVGAYYRVTWLLWLYLAVMFLLILLLFCFFVFAFVVTNKDAAQVASSRGYKEYTLGDFSNWLQKRVEKSSIWNKIKSCLQDAKACKSLANDLVSQVAEQFYKKNLSPIQSGCCKPPTSCVFVYVNATYWTSTTSNLTDVECSRNNRRDERMGMDMRGIFLTFSFGQGAHCCTMNCFYFTFPFFSFFVVSAKRGTDIHCIGSRASYSCSV